MKTIGIIIRKLDIDDYIIIGNRLDLFEIFNKWDVNTIGIPITFYNSENDYKLVQYLHENDIPTLGICLGMQSMAMTFNNREEIKIKNHKSFNKYAHNVTIEKDTFLHKIIGQDKILVNSRHNYVVPHTKFKINAISDDGYIEGIEDSQKKFFLGIQWHPESIDDINSLKLFKYFIDII